MLLETGTFDSDKDLILALGKKAADFTTAWPQVDDEAFE